MVGAYKSSEFIRRYNSPKDPGLGGSRKMVLIARSLMAGGHEVRILSSRIAYSSQWGWQLIPTTTERYSEGALSISHVPTVSKRPFGAALMSLMMPFKILQSINGWKPEVIFCYNADFPEAKVVS
jgi:hypothetical protein